MIRSYFSLMLACLLSVFATVSGASADPIDDVDRVDAVDYGLDDHRRKDEDRKYDDRKDDDREKERDRNDSNDEKRREDQRKFLKKEWTSDYIDTDFRKESFEDLVDMDEKRRYRDDRRIKRNVPPTIIDLDRKRTRRIHLDIEKESEKDDKRTIKELTRPIPGVLHDWVPAKVNRLHNGAFEKEPDNGFPVPYRLNGHLDIQRKLPWEKEAP